MNECNTDIIFVSAENNFQNFFQFGSVADFTDKFCVYNINAPGQEMDAAPLPDKLVELIACPVTLKLG